jgi:sigma-B regulation protein RsbU (phosphoserine phosphatase)
VELNPTGMALGVMADAVYEQRTVPLGAGDLVLLYTDGVTDAIDAREQEFGEARLQQALLAGRGASVEAVVAALDGALGAFVGERAPFDDMTIVAVRRC